jgi:hypothetical protein
MIKIEKKALILVQIYNLKQKKTIYFFFFLNACSILVLIFKKSF